MTAFLSAAAGLAQIVPLRVPISGSAVGEHVQTGQGCREGSQEACLNLHDSQPPWRLAGRGGRLSSVCQTSPGLAVSPGQRKAPV